MRCVGLWLACVLLLIPSCSEDVSNGATTTSTTTSDGGGGSGGHVGGGGTGGGGAAPGGSGGSSSAATVRVMTINLWNAYFNGADVDQRTQMVADAVTAFEPDFVAMQEVVQSSSIQNRAEVIAQATGYQWDYEQSYAVPFLYEEGIALLSRWPIVWRDFVELPHTDLAGQVTRLVLAAGIQTPHGEVNVFATHMIVDADQAKKADQALAAWQYMTSFASERPGFFAGDLNAEPDTLAMRFLRGEASHQTETGDLIDAWSTVNPGDQGFTIPSDAADRRIDYVYVVPGTAAVPTVDACQLVLDTPEQGVYASDHIGVICDFTLASP